MAFSFNKYLKGLFPKYFWKVDTYKDSNGENGFFERYVSNFEEEYGEEIYPFIRDAWNLLDPLVAQPQYLTYLNYMMGDIPDIGNVSVQRKLIRWIVRLWQVKGTIRGYQFIFNLFGLNVEVIEVFGPRPVRYDNTPEDEYDDEEHFYDMECPGCSDIYLVYWSQANPCGNTTNLNEETKEALKTLICLVTPIDVNFKGFIKKFIVCDDLDIDIDDDYDDEAGSCTLPGGITITNDDSSICDDTHNFVADSLAIGTANLSWDQIPSGYGYEIWVKGFGEPDSNYKLIGVYTPITVDSLILNSGFSEGATYTFRFRAIGTNGYCVWEEDSVTIMAAVCTIPSNIQVTNTI